MAGCPCCYRVLTPGEEVPRLEGIGRPGDWWCDPCAWFFSREMTEPEGDPMALDGVLRCPTHRTESKS